MISTSYLVVLCLFLARQLRIALVLYHVTYLHLNPIEYLKPLSLLIIINSFDFYGGLLCLSSLELLQIVKVFG